MQPEALVFVVGTALALVGVLALALTRGRMGVDAGVAARSVQDSLDAARSEERRLRADVQRLVDQLDAGVLRLDDDLRVTSANRAATRMLSDAPASLVGRSAMEVFVDHRVDAVARLAHERGSASGELHLRDGSGRPQAPERTLLVRARRALGGGVWLVLDDVSELRRLQRIRTEFIDNLAHELRTPLTTVRLLTETVARDLEASDVSPRLRDRIGKIDVETGHLVQMVNELLDLSRIEGGAARLRLERVEMPAVIRAAMDRLRPFADRHEIELLADLPAEDDLPVVYGDEERLGQVLVNLLHNAVKFSPEASRVVIRARPAEDEVVIAVEDQGAGVPRGELDRVFERFYKVDKARVRGVGGTGLGLAIARHIVEGHGGRIWVESEEGRGSTFSFAIPVADT